MTTTTAAAKYGYVITTTPGLIGEGTFPVDKHGDATIADHESNPVAVFRTTEEAEAHMRTLTPDGKDPLEWGGYKVVPAHEGAYTWLLYGMVEGMHGFQVPEVA